MIRALLPLLCLSIAACDKGGEDKSPPPAPLPTATAPAPRTPVMQITPAPGATPAWLEPRPHKGAAVRAPYGGTLDRSVVEGGTQR
ncbi:hypothetical protein [Sphingomonas sp. 8AM]|uniref:hypothetical protein n=1 Tax=Sphingomonas sp. 8AM TaxID=2653170 RepID=UPI0012EFBB85|nr:hypothetical protein [Sphingomonas sp. 8AM]VXC43220.1 conserved hypothetical protein [Sphingomonas sp. 8AM]